MNKKEIKALVSLLDDEDTEVLWEVEQKIASLGNHVIPILESEWEKSFNPTVQKRIEDLIHNLQFENLKDKLGVWKNSKKQDLLEGLWLVSLYHYPDLELSHLRKQLEQIYYEAWVAFDPDAHYMDQVKILNGVIFNKLKFSANTKNFHAPGNSMINVVLETRKGNPISLCMVYLLIAQKLKMPVFGVNLPNLFILTYKKKDAQFYINAFNRGLIFSREDIDNYISHLQLNPVDIFYEPCQNIDVLKRIFRNLMISFEKIGDHYKVDEIKILLGTISEPGE